MYLCSYIFTGEDMNRQDIIRMAQEAGFFIQQNEIYSMSTQSDQELTEWIERFAALVASAEREACIVDIQWHIPRSGRHTPEYQMAMRMLERIRARGDKHD